MNQTQIAACKMGSYYLLWAETGGLLFRRWPPGGSSTWRPILLGCEVSMMLGRRVSGQVMLGLEVQLLNASKTNFPLRFFCLQEKLVLRRHQISALITFAKRLFFPFNISSFPHRTRRPGDLLSFRFSVKKRWEEFLPFD